ncbi:MAG: hypothetical protein CL920_25280 [Deltaproteobacteria bacterium]|nr:hypothetical protein [Deltaproteobacteria bacterium]MBU52019.1 hypothetical protein [Deltaproteobacteria bacterium]|tara:strand:+ start:1258 stop:4086 length:2829 start_codon:yes stop_codon:yes gene_type:complete
MKIRCDECQSVFLIDDSLISDKGVKAQCPKCGFQKIVWKQSSLVDEQPYGAGWGNASPDPYGSGYGSSDGLQGLGLGATGSSFDSEPSSLDFGGMGGANDITCFKCGKPMAESPDTVLPICQDCIDKSAETPTIYSTSSSDLHAPSFDPIGAPPLQDAGPLIPGLNEQALPPDLMAATSTVYDGPSSVDVVSEIDASTALSFVDSGPTSVTEMPTSVAVHKLDPNWIKLRSDGKEIGPVSLQEVRSLYAHGKINLDDEYSGKEGGWVAIRDVPDLFSVLNRTPKLNEARPATRAPSSARKGGGGGGGRGILGAVVGLVLLGAIGGVAYYFMPRGGGGPSKVRNVGGSGLPAEKKLLTSKLKAWKQEFGKGKRDVKKSALLTRQAFALFYRDEPKSYRAAVELFKKALVRDSKNDRALAGLALSFLWSSSNGRPSLRIIREYDVILRQENRSRKSPVLRAAYAVYLARQGESKKALKKARRAAKRARGDALTLLVAGQMMLEQRKSRKVAIRYLERAMKKTPTLFRARYHLAAALSQSSRYYKATQALLPLIEKSHPRALFLNAKNKADLGLYKEAVKSLDRLVRKQPNSIEARLMLGMIAYQFLGRRSLAMKHLVRASRMEPRPLLKKKIILHLGYLALLSRRSRKVKQYLKIINEMDKYYYPAMLLKAQLYILKRKYAPAEKMLRKLMGQISDVSIRILLAYVLEMQKKQDASYKMILQIATDNSRNVWAQLMLAAVYFRKDNETQASLAIRNVLDIEPGLLKSKQKPTHFYVAGTPHRWAIRVFQKAKAEDRSVTAAATGIAYYHNGELSNAKSWLRRAVAYDRKGLAGNLYMGYLEMLDKRWYRVRRHASLVYHSYNEQPVAAGMIGWMYYHKKNYEQARTYFRRAKEARPWYVSVKIGLALTLAQEGKEKQALIDLKDMLTTHPNHHQLLQALYQLKW